MLFFEKHCLGPAASPVAIEELLLTQSLGRARNFYHAWNTVADGSCMLSYPIKAGYGLAVVPISCSVLLVMRSLFFAVAQPWKLSLASLRAKLWTALGSSSIHLHSIHDWGNVVCSWYHAIWHLMSNGTGFLLVAVMLAVYHLLMILNTACLAFSVKEVKDCIV